MGYCDLVVAGASDLDGHLSGVYSSKQLADRFANNTIIKVQYENTNHF